MREGAIHSAKTVAALLLACVLAWAMFAWNAPAHAASYGSIGLTCTVDRGGSKVLLAGDGYALVKVASAEVDSASASLAYATEDAFSAVDRNWAALDAAGLRAAAREVASYAEKQDVDPLRTARSDASGHAAFGSLETGLYLIVRYDPAPANRGFVCDPVLVSVPTKVGGALDYTVEAAPKFEGHGSGLDPDPDRPVDPDTPVGPDAPDPENPDQPAGPGEQGGSGGQGGSGDGSGPGAALGQLADKVAGALGFAKTSDGMMAVACAAAACAFAAAAVLVWRRRAEEGPRGAHAAAVTRAVDDGLSEEGFECAARAERSACSVAGDRVEAERFAHGSDARRDGAPAEADSADDASHRSE